MMCSFFGELKNYSATTLSQQLSHRLILGAWLLPAEALPVKEY